MSDSNNNNSNNDDDGDGEEAPSYDWSAYYDDNGLLYYYNAVTEESSWTAPNEGFHPPPVQQEGMPVEVAEIESGLTNHSALNSGDSEEATMEETRTQPREDNNNNNNGSADNQDGVIESSAGSWVAYTDDEGREYYYNAETGATQWEKPQDGVLLDLPPPEIQDDNDNNDYEPHIDNNRDEEHDGTPPSDDDSGDEDNGISTHSSPIPLEPERETTPEPEIDPKVKLLQDAEAGLNLPDSILELGCIDNVNILLQELGGSEGGQKAMQALVTNFNSQTAICGLLGQWLTEMKGTAETEDSDAFEVAANEIRGDVQEVICKIA
jgi:hypothetical protein